jgi:ribonuclease T1
MKWNRERVKALVIGALVLVVTLFFVKWTFDHDGETITIFGDDPTSSAPTFDTTAPADPASDVQTGDRDPDSGLPWICEDELPAEGQATLALIDQGGPFPYDKDGSTFGNFEGLLPDHPRGYYQEYTVITPGSKDRGARRIIAGDGGEFYWTEDHYESFSRIARRS